MKLPELKSGDIRYVSEGILHILIAAYIFYENLFMAVLLIPYVAMHAKECRKIAGNRRKTAMAQEFKDGIMAVSFALNVGYSIENSFAEAVNELILLYGANSDIVGRFRGIVTRLNQNENLEDILMDFAKESGVEDIAYFAEVFRYAKRSGGDIISIIRNTAGIIQGKLETAAEVETVISGKRMEQKVMSIMPFGIILYLKLTAREFIAPLYGNILGMSVMTVCLIVYVIADRWAKRIVNIDV